MVTIPLGTHGDSPSVLPRQAGKHKGNRNTWGQSLRANFSSFGIAEKE